jgi:hypothetical protein
MPILKDNGKEINQELHTIPLLSLTLQFSAHQEWEGNKTYMGLTNEAAPEFVRLIIRLVIRLQSIRPLSIRPALHANIKG